MGIAQIKRGEDTEKQREKGKFLLQEHYSGQSFQQVLHQPSTFCTAKQRHRQKQSTLPGVYLYKPFLDEMHLKSILGLGSHPNQAMSPCADIQHDTQAPATFQQINAFLLCWLRILAINMVWISLVDQYPHKCIYSSLFRCMFIQIIWKICRIPPSFILVKCNLDAHGEHVLFQFIGFSGRIALVMNSK